MRDIVINGRFLTAPQTGVQRAARELTLALDSVLSDQKTSEKWWLAVPSDAVVPNLGTIRPIRVTGPKGTLWEQSVLYRASRNAILLNLANTAPMLHRRSVILMHDAQVWDTPASYGRAFRAWYKVMQPAVAKRALGLVSVSRHSVERLAAHGIAESSKFTVIPNGLDHILGGQADYSAAEPLGNFLLSMAGSQRHKNLSFILDLFSDERLRDLRLALVGKPTFHDVPENVKFLGRVSDDQLRGLYGRARLFLYPSITEGFGLPPGEAMMCGCPVIAASGGALGEVYADSAVLLDHRDRESWITTVRQLADESKRRDNLAARGEKAVKKYTWSSAAEKYVILLQKLRQQV